MIIEEGHWYRDGYGVLWVDAVKEGDNFILYRGGKGPIVVTAEGVILREALKDGKWEELQPGPSPRNLVAHIERDYSPQHLIEDHQRIYHNLGYGEHYGEVVVS